MPRRQSLTSTNDEITVENEEHCDFKKLRSLLIRTHMLDLITTSEDSHYENYRLQQMETRKFGSVFLIVFEKTLLRLFFAACPAARYARSIVLTLSSNVQ